MHAWRTFRSCTRPVSGRPASGCRLPRCSRRGNLQRRERSRNRSSRCPRSCSRTPGRTRAWRRRMSSHSGRSWRPHRAPRSRPASPRHTGMFHTGFVLRRQRRMLPPRPRPRRPAANPDRLPRRSGGCCHPMARLRLAGAFPPRSRRVRRPHPPRCQRLRRRDQDRGCRPCLYPDRLRRPRGRWRRVRPRPPRRHDQPTKSPMSFPHNRPRKGIRCRPTAKVVSYRF
jgi:hypothetical protein